MSELEAAARAWWALSSATRVRVRALAPELATALDALLPREGEALSDVGCRVSPWTLPPTLRMPEGPRL